jgi:hypothetical protein
MCASVVLTEHPNDPTMKSLAVVFGAAASCANTTPVRRHPRDRKLIEAVLAFARECEREFPDVIRPVVRLVGDPAPEGDPWTYERSDPEDEEPDTTAVVYGWAPPSPRRSRS